jgi:hypothetical protein
MHNDSQSPVFYTQLVDFRWSLLPGALWHPELSLPENLPIKYALLPDKESERPPGQRNSLTGADGAQVRTEPATRSTSSCGARFLAECGFRSARPSKSHVDTAQPSKSHVHPLLGVAAGG